MFYTRNGQPAQPPQGAWQPTPGDIAPGAVSAGPQATSVATPSTAYGAQSHGAEDAGSPHRPKDRAPGSSRTIITSVVATVVVLLVALALAVGVQASRQRSATEPVTYEQLRQALAPGHAIGAAKLTASNQVPTDTAGNGRLCSNQLVALFSASSVMVTAVTEPEINPTTGLIEGSQFLSVSAITRPTTADARATYEEASQFSSCLGSDWSGAAGPTTDTYQTTYTSSSAWIILTHRNVVAAVEFYKAPAEDPSATAGAPDRLVTDLSKLLDQARGS